jgi:hypothetical protein
MKTTIEMAREAGFEVMRLHGVLPHVPKAIFIANVGVTEEVKRLVELARADEREACALVVENIERKGDWITKAEAAEAIRARGETK